MLFTLITCALLAFQTEGEAPKIRSSVDLKLWGRVYFNSHYDTDDVRGMTDWATYLVADGPEEWNFNPRDTRFGLQASSSFSGLKGSAVLEIDFYGENSGNNLLPRLRLGYVELARDTWSFRAGQDWIPIATQHPNMVEFGVLAWAGNLWWRVPQLTLRKSSGSWEFLASMMKHRISSSQEQQEKMPWLLGRLAHKHQDGNLALGLGWRKVEVAGVDYKPYLAVLEFKQSFSSEFSVNGEIWQGQGHAREFVRYGLDYNASQAREIESRGGFMNASATFDERNQVNFGLGMDDPLDKDTFSAGTETPIAAVPFTRNLVGYLNYKRSIGKQFGYGLELMHFSTDKNPEQKLKGQRFTFGIWYIF